MPPPLNRERIPLRRDVYAGFKGQQKLNAADADFPEFRAPQLPLPMTWLKNFEPAFPKPVFISKIKRITLVIPSRPADSPAP
jgi:hypothetical protein